jgi:hypothetical protein
VQLNKRAAAIKFFQQVVDNGEHPQLKELAEKRLEELKKPADKINKPELDPVEPATPENAT